MSVLMQATSGIRWGLRRIQQELISRPFVRHVSALTAANGMGAVLSFIQGILVARWLGPELYGVAALVMSVPALVYTFFDARSAEASVKYLSEFHVRGERERALAMCKLGYALDLGVAALAFLGVLATAGWAASDIVHRPETVSLILVYAAAFLPRAFVGTSYAVLATLGRFPMIALIETLMTVLRVALVLGLVLAGWQVAGVIWGNAVAMVATGLTYGVVAYALIQRTWNTSWLLGDWKALRGHRRAIVRFLAYNDLSVLFGSLPKQLDAVLLGYFRSPVEVGYYRVAQQFLGLTAYISGPLRLVIYPKLAKIWAKKEKDILFQVIHKAFLTIGVPLGVAFLLFYIALSFMLPIFLGRAFEPSISSLLILSLGHSVFLVSFWQKPTYLAIGGVKLWFLGLVLYFIVATSGSLGLLVLTEWGGHVAVAVAMSVATVLFQLIMSMVLLRELREACMP